MNTVETIKAVKEAAERVGGTGQLRLALRGFSEVAGIVQEVGGVNALNEILDLLAGPTQPPTVVPNGGGVKRERLAKADAEALRSKVLERVMALGTGCTAAEIASQLGAELTQVRGQLQYLTKHGAIELVDGKYQMKPVLRDMGVA